jgi:hypothetical protein
LAGLPNNFNRNNMKHFTNLFLLLFASTLLQAQSIQFDQDSATFQDADVGSMAFGDIDGDGDLDLMVIGKGGPIRSTLYKNDGLGNFAEVADTPFLNVFDGTVRFEDIDNDDDLDLLITGSTSSPIVTASLYTNNGTGVFTLVEGTILEPTQSGDFVFGDMDNDGDKDVIITGYDADGDAYTRWYANSGSGHFTLIAGTLFEAVKNSSVAFIDYDGDNDLDLIIAGVNDNNVKSTTMYNNNGSGAFLPVASTPFDAFDSGDIAVGDSDNDGDQDVLISGMNASGEVITKLYLNDGSGNFTLFANTPFSNVWLGENAFADFDNDGDLDVFVLGSGPTGLGNNDIVANIYENQGSNTFVLSDSLIGAYLSSSAIGDVDGDLGLDLVIAGTSVGSPVRATRLYRNVSPNVTGIYDNSSTDNVQVYPNPTHDILHVSVENEITAIRVYSLLGEVLFTQQSSSLDVNIDMRDYAPGFYIIGIETLDGIITQKIVKN